MTKNMNRAAGSKTVLGTNVSEKVAHLLTEIEKEPVPDRLLDLAQQLQKALNDKLEKSSD